jgi:hypothetical protein
MGRRRRRLVAVSLCHFHGFVPYLTEVVATLLSWELGAGLLGDEVAELRLLALEGAIFVGLYLYC